MKLVTALDVSGFAKSDQFIPAIPTMIKIVLAIHTTIARNGLRKMFEAADDFVLVGEADSGYTAPKLRQQVQPHIAIIDST